MKILSADVRAHELRNAIYCEKKVGVEVGVYRGELSSRLLWANKSLRLYMVDPWADTGSVEYAESGDKIAFMSQVQHEENLSQTLAAVEPFRDRCKIMRTTSEKAAKEFKDGTLDFVFIDADHSYKGCSDDIRYWWPKVKPGGLLSGHDYRDDKDYGVIQAVDEFAQTTGLPLRLGGNYTWFITKSLATA